MSKRGQKIRLLHVIRPGVGGAARYLAMLLEHLDRDRFEPSVIASSLESKEFPERLRDLGATVHVLDMTRPLSLRNDLRGFRRMTDLLRAGSYDLVHAHAAKAGFLARLAARTTGTGPVIYTPHGFYFEYNLSARKKAFYRRIEGLLGRFTDAILCTSRTEADAALRYKLVPPERVHAVPNGIDPDALLPEQTHARDIRKSMHIGVASRMVVMVGRLDPPKDPGTFLRAARHVVKIKPRTKFVLVGDGSMLAWCRDLAERLDIAKKIVVTGYRADATEILNTSSISVISSESEGLPLVLLESMALGKPVIASDIPGCREVIRHGLTGVLFPVGDERILAGAMLKLIDDKDLAHRMGAAAREYVLEHHHVKKWIREIERVYVETVEKRRRERRGRGGPHHGPTSAT